MKKKRRKQKCRGRKKKVGVAAFTIKTNDKSATDANERKNDPLTLTKGIEAEVGSSSKHF